MTTEISKISIPRAAAFAANKHEGQKYGDGAYTIHLAAVSAVLTRFGITDEELHMAAWLHDTLEDTDATMNDLDTMFGFRVGDIVWRVTNEPGKNRKERHARTYPKIAASDDAITIKLADRIANMEQSIKDNSDLLQMYIKEYVNFKTELFKAGSHDEMWLHLDKLFTSQRSDNENVREPS